MSTPPRRPNKGPKPNWVIAERNRVIITRRRRGDTARQIATALSCSISTVTAVLQKAKRRGELLPVFASPIPADLVAHLWSTGATIREIAKATGRSPAAIGAYADRHRAVCPRRVHADRPVTEKAQWRVPVHLLAAVRAMAESTGETPTQVFADALARGLGIAEIPAAGESEKDV